MAYIVERIHERAREAVEECKNSNADHDFESGRKQAYYEVLDILKSELRVHDQDPSDFGLDMDLVEELL